MKTIAILLALCVAAVAQDPRTGTLPASLLTVPTASIQSIDPELLQPTILTLAAGTGRISINLKTGQVDLPKDMTLPDAAVAFWLRVAQVFPECRRAMLTGDPTPLTTEWLGRPVFLRERSLGVNDANKLVVSQSGTVNFPRTYIQYSDDKHEIGLRSDGVMVWREAK